MFEPQTMHGNTEARKRFYLSVFPRFRLARHRFAAADFANAFVGLALDAYGSHVARQRAREIRTHLVEVRQQPGLLSNHRDIDVLDPIAAGVNDLHRPFQ